MKFQPLRGKRGDLKEALFWPLERQECLPNAEMVLGTLLGFKVQDLTLKEAKDAFLGLKDTLVRL